MKRAEGLAAVNRISPAAKEESTGMVNGLDKLAHPQSGWNPYEVWRTRVKGASSVMQERELDPLHAITVGTVAHGTLRRQSDSL
jgi:hypothetical protein